MTIRSALSVPLEKQYRLLRLEYEYEKKSFEHETAIMGIDRKVRRGDCWFPVTLGHSYYNSLDRFVVEVLHTSVGEDDIPHNFEYGRPVCFFAREGNGTLRYTNFRAIVSYAEERMVVELPGEPALASLQHIDLLGVQLYFDDYSYRVMFEALRRVMEAKDNRLAFLRDCFHTPLPLSQSAPPSVPLRFPWLNASQEQAVGDVLRAREVQIVYGPPGTGKTTTLVEAVSEVLRREPQVMVCAQSNTAVDWFCRQLSDRGISVLRIGNPSRVNPQMTASTYEHRFEAHPEYPALWQIRRTIRQLYSISRKERPAAFHQKVARLKERADELEARIRQELFDTSRVIASTLTGAANPLLQGTHYHTLFIDEAAQALEAACWIPLQRADRVILAGDYQQLPPTIKCPEALRGGLARTLMEQVAALKPEAVRLLTVQYRMHEDLMRFSSDWFYEGRLQAAPEVRHRALWAEYDAPLVWVDTTHTEIEGSSGNECGSTVVHEEFVGNSYGRINKVEAQLTLHSLRRYIARVGHTRFIDEHVDIGVISPYRAQVQYLRTLIRRDEYLRPLRAAITINTVDAFQGQERDVILVSLVRANESGQIGFLSDLRRMNVAITRARYKLIILGSSDTLCRHSFYRKLYESCVKWIPEEEVTPST